MTNETGGAPARENGLDRKLGLFPLANIVIANMIGAGIFTTSGLLLKDLGSPWLMLILWAVAGVIALCGALSYGELGAAMPRAGGEYVFLTRLFHPIFGFLSGWVSFFVGFSAPIAASAIGFSEYLTRAVPGLLRPGIPGVPVEAALLKKIYAGLVIVLFTLVHTRGIRFGSLVQNILTILKVGLIAALIGLGFLTGRGDFSHLFQGGPVPSGFAGWKSAGLALMWIMFAYSGWNASAYIGSEVRNPTRNLPRSLILGTGVVIFIYLALNLLYVYAVPPAEMSGVISVGGLAAGRLFGRSFENIFSVFISFALFSSLSAYIILGPRVYFAMAQDNRFFKFAAKVNPVNQAPTRAILLQCLISLAILASGSFEQILTYMGFSLGIFPLMAVAGVFIVRRKGMSPYRMPGYPVAPIVYILAGVLILVLGFLRSPGPSAVALLTVAAGIPVYFIIKGAYGRKPARPG